ncbi:MAG: (Fe-S)-binding protein, partial [Desulfatitalea sp.]|nr:(Fe-S)-binding protein [Desulfatitalea sp.]
VSCGTCREALKRIGVADIFDAPISDVASFVLARGVEVSLPVKCFYHAPCHDSLEGRGEELLRAIAPQGVESIPHCCAEAGTLALSRPDIAAAMLARKRSALAPRLAEAPRHLLLTNCPACLNGLGRQVLTRPQHLAVALADASGGAAWRGIAARHLARAESIGF